MKELGFLTQHYLIYTPYTLFEDITLPSYIWEEIQKATFSSKQFTPLEIGLIIEFFKNSRCHVDEDIPTQRLLLKRVQAEVPEKVTHVSAGNRIVDQGEKVAARHIAMLQAMKKVLGESRNLSHPLTFFGIMLDPSLGSRNRGSLWPPILSKQLLVHWRAVNEESLTERMERIAREKVDNGQFDQCLLTFEELSLFRTEN
jgi:membrane-associated HD superfamily phosphohydrolase